MRHLSVFKAFSAFLFGLCLLGSVAGLASGGAQAAGLSAIVVEGNQRVEADTVRSYMQIQPGETVTTDKIDASVKALFQTGLFADVKISQKGSQLTVVVEENPLINKVSFEGNSEIKDDALGKEVELKERLVFTRAKVQSDVQRVIALYRRSGYFAARVEPKIIRLPQNRVNLVFEVQEGVSTRIARINFVGNKAFTDSQLRSSISTAQSSWWKFFSTSDNYDPDRLNYDKESLRRYYLKNGYADFRVVSANAELAPDGESFYITFSVEEGPRYEIGNVSVNTGQTSLDAKALEAAIRTPTGSQYDASRIDRTVEAIALEAGKSGFAFAKVDPQIDRDAENRKLNIVYNVQEGPRVYIERIDIRGNVRTLDEVIRREMQLAEGDAYNRVLVDRARRRLIGLNFFQAVDFREEAGSSADRLVLVLDVQEKSTGAFSISAGYSSAETLIASIGIQERNLLGRGQNINLNTTLSFKRQSVNFAFTEPYFLGRRVSAGVDAVISRNDLKDEASYTNEQFGGGFRFGFKLDEDQSLTTRYNLVHRDMQTTSSAPVAIQEAEGTSIKSAVTLGYVFDTIDNPASPTSGFRINPSIEVAGLGGDVNFLSGEVSSFFFHPITDGITFKLKGTGGQQVGLGDDEVPVLDRFYKGGDSFRGFAPSGIGPRQEKDDGGKRSSIGGTSYAIGTAEVIFPLGLPEEFGLSASVFSDFGTLFGAPEEEGKGKCNNGGLNPECSVWDTAAFRGSAGAGVTWESPFGPLRFDVAYPFAKADYDETEYFRFSIGSKF
jgi:outer membrane protein insertion porin family